MPAGDSGFNFSGFPGGGGGGGGGGTRFHFSNSDDIFRQFFGTSDPFAAGGGGDDPFGRNGGGMGGMGGSPGMMGGMGGMPGMGGMGGMPGMGGAGARKQQPMTKDPPVNHTLFVTLVDVFNGTTKKMRITRKLLDASGRTTQVSVDKEIAVKQGWKG